LSRRQSLRWAGAAVVGVAGLPGLALANDYEDYSRALVSDNSSAMVNLIFRGFNANTLDSRGRPGLVAALHQDSLKVFDVLLKAPRIDVNLASRQNETPLMMACIKGHLDIVRELIKRGADVNREAGRRCTMRPLPIRRRRWTSSSCCWKKAPISMPHRRTAARR
jgi:hypothetical protein